MGDHDRRHHHGDDKDRAPADGCHRTRPQAKRVPVQDRARFSMATEKNTKRNRHPERVSGKLRIGPELDVVVEADKGQRPCP